MDTEGFLNFRITSIKQETRSARTYELQPLNTKKLKYKPWQFLTFIIQTQKQELRRSYSLLTLPDEPTRITVKKVENGLISRYILQHWKEGEILKSLHPAGRFTLDPITDRKRDIFCFAAGSGIIPILPQIRMLLMQESESNIHLIYSNHNENDALFLNEIEILRENFPALSLINLFSEPLFRVKEKGRLSNVTTESLINDLLKYQKSDAVFLLCGSFAYMRMLSFTIGSMHFKKENIKRENYLPEVMRSERATHQTFPDRNITIEIRNTRHTIQVPSGQCILDAALNRGLNLPYSCKGGVCGNCAAICKSGKVYMSINEVLTDADLNQGWVLTCTGYPETENIIIDYPTE